jgi:hypothetical protein
MRPVEDGPSPAIAPPVWPGRLRFAAIVICRACRIVPVSLSAWTTIPASSLDPAATMPAPRNGFAVPQPVPVITSVDAYAEAVAVVVAVRSNCHQL